MLKLISRYRDKRTKSDGGSLIEVVKIVEPEVVVDDRN